MGSVEVRNNWNSQKENPSFFIFFVLVVSDPVVILFDFHFFLNVFSRYKHILQKTPMDSVALRCLGELHRFELVFQNLFTDFFQIVGTDTQCNVGFIMEITAVGTTIQTAMF